MTYLVDLRRRSGSIRNSNDLISRHGLGPGAEKWSVDKLLYEGFRKTGATFLDQVDGRFAAAYYDPERNCAFFARDWIGEVPFHWIVTEDELVVSNSLMELRRHLGASFAYGYARSFPQSKFAVIEPAATDSSALSRDIRFAEDGLYFDFADLCSEHGGRRTPLRSVVRRVRSALLSRIERQLADGSEAAILLSGGLDSLSIALGLRLLQVPVKAYTLSVGSGGRDVARAAEYAKYLGLEHRVVRVSKDEVIRAAESAVEISEIYHCYNVFCAVGMLLLGERLAQDGIDRAFCGEAVNEALGDYRDWKVLDPMSRSMCVLQRIDTTRMQRVSERALYVWGQPTDRGKYNRQLGTGLAKHAGSRMFKPFIHHGVELEAPYYDRGILSEMVAIEPEVLHSNGGKPGFFARLFERDLENLGVPESAITTSEKVRLQDASDGGENGITPILMERGFTQQNLVERFNECFGSSLDPEREARRLLGT